MKSEWHHSQERVCGVGCQQRSKKRTEKEARAATEGRDSKQAHASSCKPAHLRRDAAVELKVAQRPLVVQQRPHLGLAGA